MRIEKQSCWFYGGLFFVFFIFLISHNPIIDNDSPSYIHAEITRQPVYPIFIALFSWAKQYQLTLVMWAQSLLTFLSLCFSEYWIRKNLNFSRGDTILIFLVTLPTIIFYYQIQHIASEGITFPLFIFLFFNLLDCFKNMNTKNAILILVLISLLVLTRTQFYSFYAIFFILLLYHWLKKYNVAKLALFFMLFIFSAAMTHFLDRSYHYFQNQHFITEPLSGPLLLVQPMYLGNNVSSGAYATAIQKKIELRKLNVEAAKLNHTKIQHYQYAFEEYSLNYNKILKIVCNIYTGNACIQMGTIPTNTLIKMNNDTLQLSKLFFQNNIKKNIIFYIYKITDAMGGIILFIFFSIIMLITVFRLGNRNSGPPSYSILFIFLALLFTYLNAMVVAMAEPNLTVYYCYSQFLLYCLAVLFGKFIFEKMHDAI